MFRALVRNRADAGDDWTPVTFHGEAFFADYTTLVQMLSAMSQNFPHLEYRMEAMDDIED